jgi:hypothetical protein
MALTDWNGVRMVLARAGANPQPLRQPTANIRVYYAPYSETFIKVTQVRPGAFEYATFKSLAACGCG